MKKRISILLAVLIVANLCVLPGCGKKTDVSLSDAAVDQSAETNQSIPVDEPESESDEAADATAAEDGLNVISDTLGLSKENLAGMEVAAVQHYGDETVVHYTQTYCGVEIYGSSLVAVTGDDAYCAGTYYDLSEAFSGDFDALAAEAGTVPAWMVDETTEEVSIFYDTNTLRPVIYITEDGKTVVARYVQAVIECDGQTANVELITDIEGGICYSCNELARAFSSTTVTHGSDSLEVSSEDDTYYAYNQTYHTYVFYDFTGDRDSLNKYFSNNGISIDKSKIYAFQGREIHSSEDLIVFQTLSAYTDVAAWYDETFGYEGVNGNGGGALLSVGVKLDPLGMNGGKYDYSKGDLFLLSETVIQYPEIIAHEFGHAVMHHIVSLQSDDEGAALDEGLADVFACLYQDDPSWQFASYRSLSEPALKTKDEYIYDYAYMADSRLQEGFNKLFYSIFLSTESSSNASHENGQIIGHVMYRIWDEVFHRDNDAFGAVLYRSLRYLPSSAGFSEFRDAFLYAMSLSSSEEDIPWASTFFDVAKIYTAGRITTLKARAAAEEVSNLNALKLFHMNYGEIQALDWDELLFFEVYDSPGTWFCQCRKGDIAVDVSFNSETEDLSAVPVSIWVTDTQGGSLGVPITSTIRTGMTYGELAQLEVLSELQPSEFGGLEYVVMEAYFLPELDCMATLYFNGQGDNAVLTDAQIVSINQETQ